MRMSFSVWRQRIWLWLPALIFFALNLVFFSAYRLIYAGQVQLLDQRVARSEAEVADLLSRRDDLQELLDRASFNRQEVVRFYEERFATESQRLTRVINEVKGLARQAGLEPAAISYPEETIQEYGLLKKSFVFSVEGTYLNLRKLVNFLELSDSFLTLERIGLAESGGPNLRIDLMISTLFVSESETGGPDSGSGGRGRS
jgi:uncharacterized protein YfcZ (UPF0381/DUF406 family)